MDAISLRCGRLPAVSLICGIAAGTDASANAAESCAPTASLRRRIGVSVGATMRSAVTSNLAIETVGGAGAEPAAAASSGRRR